MTRLLITSFLRDANKLRIKILRDIEQLKKGSNGKSEEEQLKRLEDGMAQYVHNQPLPPPTEIYQRRPCLTGF